MLIVCLVDQNVEENFGDDISKYFSYHNIKLEKLVYRLEIDKSYENVGKILGDFKHIGVSRNDVLIMGGGVLADIGGFACALYHRNTPYVNCKNQAQNMLRWSDIKIFLVYHTPILSFFFSKRKLKFKKLL